MNNASLFLTLLFSLCGFTVLTAQDSAQSCKVVDQKLVGSYKGECKKGFAHGNGEAIGIDRYKGEFKFGFPEGKGLYYYGDSIYHSGMFQEGIKEGKGEMHYLRSGMPDSIVKGYWSGDIYRGKRYITYTFDGIAKFDRYEITPSDRSGNSVTIYLSSTTGSPNGIGKAGFGGGPNGYVLRIRDVVALDGSFIRKTGEMNGTNKYFISYELNKFPVTLLCTLSNNQSFKLEFYRSANWTVNLYTNK
ncbi:hypothetical protein ACQ33O_01915 [Ferruginibacter sp. SUN002]|uniref:hypothetical protein n=1 Tax=Ferruginibacter sp. SUN002 TaxID=2937789 RepID=UPI003D36060C